MESVLKDKCEAKGQYKENQKYVFDFWLSSKQLYV